MNVFQALEKLGINPSKRFSQNFLIDPNIPAKIVREAEVINGDKVLEIGPGLGSLTKALLDAKADVVAIEKDRRFISFLKEQFPDITLYEEDFLSYNLDNLKGPQKLKVVANLPYNITSPILIKLVQREDLFTSLTLMVQQEVADRIVAKPHSKAIGSLTYFINYFGDPKLLFKVSRRSFYPAPKVDSAIIHIALRPPPPVHSPETLFTLIRTLFQHRRKMLRASLKILYPLPLIEEACTSVAIDPKSRPEDLSLQDFIRLSDQLSNK